MKKLDNTMPTADSINVTLMEVVLALCTQDNKVFLTPVQVFSHTVLSFQLLSFYASSSLLWVSQ